MRFSVKGRSVLFSIPFLFACFPVSRATFFAPVVCDQFSSSLAFSNMTTNQQWESTLKNLPPPKGGRLPSVFLAHGSPLLIYPEGLKSPFPLDSIGGPKGPHQQFLRFFGPWLLEHYKPRALVVFSAHWETQKQVEITSYDDNPLFYDYYGFPQSMYEITWKSKGSAEVADRVADLLKKANIPARTLSQGRGLDHGVFVPFKLMFPDPCPIPLVEVSMPSLDPQSLIDVGKAIAPLRDEGILIISGGLNIHTFQEWEAWDPATAPKGFKDWNQAVIDAIETGKSGEERNEALKATTKHPFFRRAHPREEHYVPIYVAAGAGTEGDALAVCKLHGAVTALFGL